ncbi:hypothetical protein HK104_005843 [Borealophlyctis nickersoniae]|nr:hypothetical protein HK104_005843 [Borealophlyctis nickersoniae]
MSCQLLGEEIGADATIQISSLNRQNIDRVILATLTCIKLRRTKLAGVLGKMSGLLLSIASIFPSPQVVKDVSPQSRASDTDCSPPIIVDASSLGSELGWLSTEAGLFCPDVTFWPKSHLWQRNAHATVLAVVSEAVRKAIAGDFRLADDASGGAGCFTSLVSLNEDRSVHIALGWEMNEADFEIALKYMYSGALDALSTIRDLPSVVRFADEFEVPELRLALEEVTFRDMVVKKIRPFDTGE